MGVSGKICSCVCVCVRMGEWFCFNAHVCGHALVDLQCRITSGHACSCLLAQQNDESKPLVHGANDVLFHLRQRFRYILSVLFLFCMSPSPALPLCLLPSSASLKTTTLTGASFALCSLWVPPSTWTAPPCTRRWRPSSSPRSTTTNWTLARSSPSGTGIVFVHSFIYFMSNTSFSRPGHFKVTASQSIGYHEESNLVNACVQPNTKHG